MPELPSGYGQVAYQGYCEAAEKLYRETGYTGKGSTPWDLLDQRLRDAWDASAQAVADYLDRIPR